MAANRNFLELEGRLSTFLKQHAKEIHKALKRGYGKQPVSCSEVAGLIRRMYPAEDAVPDFLDFGNSHDAGAFIAANILAHKLGLLDFVRRKQEHKVEILYRVAERLPQRYVQHILHIYCRSEEVLHETLNQLGTAQSIGSVDDRVLYQLMPDSSPKYNISYHFKPGEEDLAWQTFAAARKIPGTISKLEPKAMH